MKKIGMISLGCPKNLVDTEALLGDLAGQGYQLTSNEEEADIIIVNTCGFLGSAVKESVDTILEMARFKSEGKCEQLIVTGCLAERHPEDLLKEIPEIDHLLGVKQYPMLKKLLQLNEDKSKRNHVNEPAQYFESCSNRVLTTPFYTAYVKISEGCSNKCAFCVIPKMRGPIHSRPLDSLVEEVRQLAGRGVKEINLVSQDTTLYGYDIRMKDGLVRLLQSLEEVEGVEWIRLLYCYPTAFTLEMMDVIGRLSKVCNYIDVPLQHTHDFMLKHMVRQETEKGVREMIDNLRSRIPDVALRTTLLTGFPGETEPHFQHMADFVKEMEFDHLGVFAYSDEEGTAAYGYQDKVPQQAAEERRDTLLNIQQEISKRKNADKVGKVYPVLVEGADAEESYLVTGRMSSQAPDIDGQVIIENSEVEPGQILSMQITGSMEYDLVARSAESGMKVL